MGGVGSASQLSYHGARRGAFSLALGSGSVAVEVTAIAKAKVLHGVLMLLGWGVLLPSGVLIARFLKWKGPVWLKLHIGLQISGLALGLAGLALALTQFGPLGGSLGGHGQMGLIVSALGLLQPLNGLLRPHKGVIRTPRRRAWEAIHKSLGYLALTLAVPTLVTGILTLDEQEAIALPAALPGFGCAYAAVLALLVLGAAWTQQQGRRHASHIGDAQDASRANKPQACA